MAQFNEVRMKGEVPMRVWGRGGAVAARFMINPEGLMRMVPVHVINKMRMANHEEAALAFPKQDELP